jgi:hypothetical protein
MTILQVFASILASCVAIFGIVYGIIERRNTARKDQKIGILEMRILELEKGTNYKVTSNQHLPDYKYQFRYSIWQRLLTVDALLSQFININLERLGFPATPAIILLLPWVVLFLIPHEIISVDTFVNISMIFVAPASIYYPLAIIAPNKIIVGVMTDLLEIQSFIPLTANAHIHYLRYSDIDDMAFVSAPTKPFFPSHAIKGVNLKMKGENASVFLPTEEPRFLMQEIQKRRQSAQARDRA